MAKNKYEVWITKVEKTHLPYLPVDKAIKNVSYEIKLKFWLGCAKLWFFWLLAASICIWLIPAISPWYLVAPFVLLNYWWFRKWNVYLRNEGLE